jgi:hypothetical protein
MGHSFTFGGEGSCAQGRWMGESKLCSIQIAWISVASLKVSKWGLGTGPIQSQHFGYICI